MPAFFKKPLVILMALLLSANLSLNLSRFQNKYSDIDPGQYKNIILFIGDGMGYNSLYWTEKEYDVELEMLTRSPIHGFSKTRSSSNAVTDSAAGGTALACATRTTNRAVGVFPQDQYSAAYVAMNLCELAQSYGRMTGVVTTDTNNGATPATFSAHTDDRGNGEEISRQQVENSNLDLLWAAKSGYVSEAYANEFGWTYLDSMADFDELEEGERSFGQFEGEIWREKSGADSPTLSAMTAKAIDMLDDDDDGFFLMVEGAHIDKNSHNNNSEGMTAAAMEFNRAINGAYDYADRNGDTLIVITADHETGGIKLDKNGDYYYTKTSHSSTNVPILVYGCDKFIKNGETIPNKEIARRLSLAMGAGLGDFPCAISVDLINTKKEGRQVDPGQYKNVILFIGDGMGYNSLAYTEKEYATQLEMLTRSPYHGFSQTRSYSDKVTDSAAGGTALACAIRTKNGALGVYPLDTQARISVAMNLCELAQSYGRMAGVVTTDANSGATPAAFSAHVDSRSKGEEISRQQVENSGLNLLWSARSGYVSEEYANEYGWTYLDSLADFEALEEGERSFGQFDGKIWRDQPGADSPTLSAMTAKAVDMLDDDPDGFFLMVEGAHIDKCSHGNDGEGMTAAAMEFNHAIKWAFDYADSHGDTLIVITADHETGGIQQDDNGQYYYTTDGHTATDVPILVYGCDNFIKNGDTIKNKEIGRRLSLAMGAENGDFPKAIKAAG